MYLVGCVNQHHDFCNDIKQRHENRDVNCQRSFKWKNIDTIVIYCIILTKISTLILLGWFERFCLHCGHNLKRCSPMGLSADTWNCVLRMRRERFPRHQRKPLVSNPGMHHGTCVTHAPWCLSGSLTCGGRGKHSREFPAHAQPTILRIWQEAHETDKGEL